MSRYGLIRRIKRVQPWTVVWLAFAWILLWGSVTWGTVLAGIGIGLAVSVLLPMPAIDFRGKPHPWYVVSLIFWFLGQVVKASIDVIKLAFKPGVHPPGAIIRVELKSHSDLYLTLTSEIATLVPGSVVMEARRAAGIIYLHVLDIEGNGGVDAAKAYVLEIEERVLRALGSPEELAECGYDRYPRLAARRRAKAERTQK